MKHSSGVCNIKEKAKSKEWKRLVVRRLYVHRKREGEVRREKGYKGKKKSGKRKVKR